MMLQLTGAENTGKGTYLRGRKMGALVCVGFKGVLDFGQGKSM